MTANASVPEPETSRPGLPQAARVVAGTVQQDLLHVGAAQAREGRLHPHPVLRRERQLVDLLEPDGREAGDERVPVDAPADGRNRLAGQAVPEHQRLHVVRYLTLIRVPSSAPWQISRMTPAAATSNTCMVSDCSLASTNALVSMIRTPTASASS